MVRAVAAFFGTASLWLAFGAHAERPLAVIRDSPAFLTVEAAAAAALAVAISRSARHEFGGVIFEIAGRYYYTDPVTSHRRDECSYDAEGPAGARLAAFYHTHPDHEMAEYFSMADIANATRYRVKSYIGVVSTGEMRVFDHETMRASFVWRKEHYGRVARGVPVRGAQEQEEGGAVGESPPLAQQLGASQ